MSENNRKEELGVMGSEIKGVEKEIFTIVGTSGSEVEELKDTMDISDTNQLFYSNQSTYNMEGESLW